MISDHEENQIILISNPQILAVKIKDNQEPLFELKDQHAIIYGPSPEIPNNTDYTKLRKTVYEKLKAAQTLLPQGLRFCLYEGYRSIALQQMLFDDRFQRNKINHPDWSFDEIFNETTKLVAPVINQDGSLNVPPHSTGGAIDVYLIDEKGEALDMGIHPKDWIEDDGALSLTASKLISSEAKVNRKIMSDVLEALDFVNYKTEYWHWSYGDRYWAYHKKAAYAFYDKYSSG